jgi:nucleoside-specific outer membrane channel protein Tsx
MTKIFIKTVIVVTLFFYFIPTSSAETFFRDNSISYLKNTSNFEVLENDDVNVITFEHASSHHWGDVFVFIDRVNASKDNNNPEFKQTYGEASARLSLSLSYLAKTKLSYGSIKDFYLATTWEHSTVADGSFGSGFDNYLVGIGSSWSIKGFNFVNANVYHANNENTDNDYQLTM